MLSHINMDSSVPSPVQALYKIQSAQRVSKLGWMVKLSITEVIQEPKECTDSVVMVINPDETKVHTDAKDLNKAVKQVLHSDDKSYRTTKSQPQRRHFQAPGGGSTSLQHLKTILQTGVF